MALTANRTDMQGKIEGRDTLLTIKNAATVFEGGLVGADADGAQPLLSTVAGLQVAGFCVRSDGLGDAGGTKKCIVRRRGTQVFKKTSATAADLLKTAYAVDDETVATLKPSATGGYDYPVGQIVRIVSSSLVEVDVEQIAPAVAIASKTATVGFAAFTDGGGASGTLLVPALDIPANSIVIGWSANVTAAFTGGVSAALEVGTAADPDRYNGSVNPSVFTTGRVGSGLGSNGDGDLFVGANTATQLTVTAAADFTLIAAGSMQVTIFYIPLA